MLHSTSSYANSVKSLYQSVNSGVVELHVKSLAEPTPGQVNFKASTFDSLGSGSVIDENGRILTAAHVVDRATKIKVVYANGVETSGHVVWVNPLIDLAMIQAAEKPDEIPVLPLAEAGDYQIGDQVVVIGAPYGVSHSLSVGYLSGIRDKDALPGASIAPRFLQTDAAINTGNSGGPMFNDKGKIIGVVSYILTQSGGSQGLGFVVSIDTVRQVLDSDPGTFAGFIPHLLTKQESKAINNPYGFGLLIQQVIPGTAADHMGFRGGHLNVLIGKRPLLLGGDIIIKIANRPLKDFNSVVTILNRIREYERGDKVEIFYIREGQEKRAVWEIE